MRLLSVGDHVRPGTYPFHSAFSRAVNFENHGRLISVVTGEIGPGPANIVLRASRLDGTGSEPFPPLKISAKTVLFANRRFHFTPRHRYKSALDLKPVALWRFRRNLPAFGELLRRHAPPQSLAFLLDGRRLRNHRCFERAFARQIRHGVQQAFHGDLLEGIHALKGCGPGLTPGGDDFIAGMLIALNLLERLHGRNLQALAERIFNAAQGASIFSNTFLYHARQGLLFGRVKDLLRALAAGSQETVRKATEHLLSLGASSGADLATGFFLTVRSGFDREVCSW